MSERGEEVSRPNDKSSGAGSQPAAGPKAVWSARQKAGGAPAAGRGPVPQGRRNIGDRTVVPSRPKIIVLVGLPGSGKSTYAKKLGAPLSSDEIRRLLADDPNDQTIHSRVFAVLRGLLKQRVELRRPVTYIDATNLTRRERKPYLKIAAEHDCSIEAIFFDVPVKICQRRNRKRDRVVPDAVIEKMAARLAPPSVEEGFEKVCVIGASGRPRR